MFLGSWQNRVWGELSCSYGVHILWGFFSIASVRGDFNPHFVSLLLPSVIFLPVISWGVTANCSCLTLLEVSTESPGLGSKRFLSPPPLSFSAVRAVLQHMNMASPFLLPLTTYEHLPGSSQKSIVFKGICKIHDSFVYLYFWLRVQMGNSRILEPATFANGMRRPHCQEWKSHPSSLECCSWLLIAWSQRRGS